MGNLNDISFVQFSEMLRNALQKPFSGEAVHAKMSPTGDVKNLYFDAKKVQNCGVLILLYPHNNEFWFALIKRTDTLQYHGGQISLPGGKMEPSDADVRQTALRETSEELGISQDEVQVVGQLSPVYIEKSGFLVFPSLGLLPKKPVFNICQYEVSELIEVKIKDFFSDKNHNVQTFNMDGKEREVPYYMAGKHIVWGATAKILSEFEMLLMK